jgi:hypothetical protein
MCRATVPQTAAGSQPAIRSCTYAVSPPAPGWIIKGKEKAKEMGARKVATMESSNHHLQGKANVDAWKTKQGRATHAAQRGREYAATFTHPWLAACYPALMRLAN